MPPLKEAGQGLGHGHGKVKTKDPGTADRNSPTAIFGF